VRQWFVLFHQRLSGLCAASLGPGCYWASQPVLPVFDCSAQDKARIRRRMEFDRLRTFLEASRNHVRGGNETLGSNPCNVVALRWLKDPTLPDPARGGAVSFMAFPPLFDLIGLVLLPELVPAVSQVVLRVASGFFAVHFRRSFQKGGQVFDELCAGLHDDSSSFRAIFRCAVDPGHRPTACLFITLNPAGTECARAAGTLELVKRSSWTA
jgi:hypothetical protein